METNQLLLLMSTGVVVFPAVAAGIAIGKITTKAVDAIARQPEAGAKISSVTLIGAALAEATAIYGLFVAIIMLFLRWS
jgi:F-type H+-transporting ATPase subunit c